MTAEVHFPGLSRLDTGEEAAIRLAIELGAQVLLTDDRAAAVSALRVGLTVTGTSGILQQGARCGRIDLAEAFARLRRTNFRYRQDRLDHLFADTGDDTGDNR